MKKNGIPQNSTGKKQVRIGQKVGKMVIIMQMVSVIFAVAMCVIMFRSLTTGMLEQRCTNGTNMLSYTLGLTSEEQDINALDRKSTRLNSSH